MNVWERDPNRVKCFFMDPSGEVEIETYRSTTWSSGIKCSMSQHGGGHWAYLPFGIGKEVDDKGHQESAGYLTREKAEGKYGLDKFPTECQCGYKFTNADEWGHRLIPIYQRRDDPSVRYTLQKAPDGAMYFATWYEKHRDWCGLDGHALMVKAPGGHDWHVDGRCSNCTRPEDKVHKCWCRHGDPTTGDVTVNKVGDTCSAGAGSLLLKNWHGFLTSGWLHT